MRQRTLTILFFLSSVFIAHGQIVRDIIPGKNGSGPTYFQKVNNLVFFLASTPETGYEWWQSDGTPEGTKLAADIFPGSNGSDVVFITPANDKLYFGADDGVHGRQLWVINGSTTEMLTNALGEPANMIPFKDSLFFASNPTTVSMASVAIHKTNGTLAGTSQVKDGPGVFATGQNHFIYFMNNGITQLHNQNDEVLATLKPALYHYYYPQRYFNSIGDVILFSAEQEATGMELWRSDGTAEGTFLIKDISPGQHHSDPYNLIRVGDKVMFTAYTAAAGKELWITDGTSEGTKILKDLYPGAADGISEYTEFAMTPFGIIFPAYVGDQDLALFKTDGTPEGTVMIHDVDGAGFVRLPFVTSTDTSSYISFFDHVYRYDNRCGFYKISLPSRVYSADIKLIGDKLLYGGHTDEAGYELFAYDIHNDPSTTLQTPVIESALVDGVKVLTTNTDSNHTLQWFKDGIALENATENTLTVTTNGTYTVRTALGTCAATSADFTVSISGTENYGIEKEKLTFHPNPGTTNIKMFLPSLAPCTIYIVDNKGAILRKFNSAGSLELLLPTDGLPAGLYTVIVNTVNQSFSGRFVRK